jgi:Rrf2 family protein
MATNNQFSISVHLMAALGYCTEASHTSASLAASVNTNPSFLRRILSQLAKAGLVHTTTGKSGTCALAKDPQKISLLDIYRAVDAPKVFAIHQYPKQSQCTVSCNIKSSLEKFLHKAQHAMEQNLKNTSLAEVIKEIKKK